MFVLQVAWTNLEGKTFTYQQERVIDDNRVSVLRPYTKEWNLQIWNVKYADQGEYRCTLNTDPVMSKVVMLYVKGQYKLIFKKKIFGDTVEPFLRGHPDERPLDYVNLNINVLISTPDERPPVLKGHFSSAKEVASQEGFHCIDTPKCDLF